MWSREALAASGAVNTKASRIPMLNAKVANEGSSPTVLDRVRRSAGRGGVMA
jgi:hypothetical protein